MPLDMVMYVYVDEYRQAANLIRLGEELISHFDLCREDFGSGGPLVYLPREDYDLAHVESKPGFLLDLNMRANYYFVGYERGDARLIVQVAEWLEERLPACKVYYGEDSSGIGRPFGQLARAKLMNYYSKVGYEPYSNKDLTREQQEKLHAMYET